MMFILNGSINASCKISDHFKCGRDLCSYQGVYRGGR